MCIRDMNIISTIHSSTALWTVVILIRRAVKVLSKNYLRTVLFAEGVFPVRQAAGLLPYIHALLLAGKRLRHRIFGQNKAVHLKF